MTRTSWRGIMTRDGTITGTEPGKLIVRLLEDSVFPVTMKVPYQGTAEAGQPVELKLRNTRDGHLEAVKVTLMPGS